MIENIVLKNIITSEEIPMDMKATIYILQSIDWGVVEGSHHSYKYVNQIGVHVIGTTLEARNVKIIGWVTGVTEDQLRKRKAVLNKMINPQQAIDISTEDYVLRILPESSILYSVNYAENNEIVCKFQIDGFCPDPLFKNLIETKTTVAGTLPKFRFPLIIPETTGIIMGLKQTSLIVNILNKGAVDVGMRIVFRAIGTVTNPILIDIKSQQFFKLNKVMVAGEVIEVVTILGEKRIIGTISGEEFNYFKYRDFDSSWLKLVVGDNLLRYDAETNLDSLEVWIYHNDKYLEVQ